MKYAVISLAGAQYKITEGLELSVNNLNKEKGDKLVLDQVHLVVEDGKVSLGEPLVKNATIEATVVDNFKDKKVRVAKFRAKSRHRVVNGFRALKTKIIVNKIVS